MNEDTENIHPYLRFEVKLRNRMYNNKVFDTLLSSFGHHLFHAEIIDINQPCKTIICSWSCLRLFVPLRNKTGIIRYLAG